MSRRILISLLAAAVAAAAIVAWMSTRATDPRAATLRAEPTSAFYSLIDSRSGDSAPLTLAEVFGPGTERLVAGESAMVRQGSAEELSDCAEALTGAAAATGCTQALRAAYVGTDGTVAGQFVILNLPDGRAADALVAALGKTTFVRQAVPFDATRSAAQARALGHYVTVTWAGPTTQGASTDLVQPQIALDTLGRIVQTRLINAG